MESCELAASGQGRRRIRPRPPTLTSRRPDPCPAARPAPSRVQLSLTRRLQVGTVEASPPPSTQGPPWSLPPPRSAFQAHPDHPAQPCPSAATAPALVPRAVVSLTPAPSPPVRTPLLRWVSPAGTRAPCGPPADACPRAAAEPGKGPDTPRMPHRRSGHDRATRTSLADKPSVRTRTRGPRGARRPGRACLGGPQAGPPREAGPGGIVPAGSPPQASAGRSDEGPPQAEGPPPSHPPHPPPRALRDNPAARERPRRGRPPAGGTWLPSLACSCHLLAAPGSAAESSRAPWFPSCKISLATLFLPWQEPGAWQTQPLSRADSGLQGGGGNALLLVP